MSGCNEQLINSSSKWIDIVSITVLANSYRSLKLYTSSISVLLTNISEIQRWFSTSSINSTARTVPNKSWYSNVDQKMATYWFMTRVTIVRRVNVTHTWQWFWDFDSHEHHDWCLVDSISLIPFDVEISLYHSRIGFRALHLYSAKLLTRN